MTVTSPDAPSAPAPPRRPALAWLALVVYLVAVAGLLGSLLWTMWTAVFAFADAAWLHRAVPTALGDPLRALLVSAVWLAFVGVGALASITGYYAWAGFAWTRWWGLATLALGGLTFLGAWFAPWCLVPLAIGAGLLWLPGLRDYHRASDAARQPGRPVAAEPTSSVVYGPISRYAS